MLPIVWKVRAVEDLAKIIRYIAEDNPIAAKRMRQRLSDAVLPVSEHPYLYAVSARMSGCREIVVHPNYLLVYRVSETSIEVLRVLHARRMYP